MVHFSYSLSQVDLEIQRIVDESFLWMVVTFANPQGGMDQIDKLPLIP